ncbi:MAG: hypothetical protein VYC39_08405 [Myxococcota bacterium]|nr:hypothetical protein [Myxococcota bacterium]
MEEERKAIFRKFGATNSQADKLLAYSNASFDPTSRESELSLPLADENHVSSWLQYKDESEELGVIETLSKYLVQLRFPIQAGISTTEVYRAATRKGDWSAATSAPEWKEPDTIELHIHPTAAGHVPVILAPNREDFVTLIRALVRRNEPAEIPASMGAAAIKGFNNWSRIFELTEEWKSQQPGREDANWNTAFRSINPSKSRYQDAFIILSRGPYSNTSAQKVGCELEDWLSKSLSIRLEHECAHYFCRRVYGSMHNNFRDELIADYAGLVAAVGHFRADWFLKFMGLGADGTYDGEGRLDVYRGNLDDDCLRIIGKVIVAAAENLETADQALPVRTAPGSRELLSLSDRWLEQVADDSSCLDFTAQHSE